MALRAASPAASPVKMRTFVHEGKMMSATFTESLARHCDMRRYEPTEASAAVLFMADRNLERKLGISGTWHNGRELLTKICQWQGSNKIDEIRGNVSDLKAEYLDEPLDNVSYNEGLFRMAETSAIFGTLGLIGGTGFMMLSIIADFKSFAPAYPLFGVGVLFFGLSFYFVAKYFIDPISRRHAIRNNFDQIVNAQALRSFLINTENGLMRA